ncbi:hypothetical protein OIO90_003650 [Microbotryomycetes sp. JL221]|nr:hypothetical protein OIO90_003650 [Microbotryomycetes sp. JL221]
MRGLELSTSSSPSSASSSRTTSPVGSRDHCSIPLHTTRHWSHHTDQEKRAHYSKVWDQDDDNSGTDQDGQFIGHDRIGSLRTFSMTDPSIMSRSKAATNLGHLTKRKWIWILGSALVLSVLMIGTTHETTTTTSPSPLNNNNNKIQTDLTNPVSLETSDMSTQSSKLNKVKQFWNKWWWLTNNNLEQVEEEIYGLEAPGEAESVENVIQGQDDDEQNDDEQNDDEQNDDEQNDNEPEKDEDVQVESLENEQDEQVPGEGNSSIVNVKDETTINENQEEGDIQETSGNKILQDETLVGKVKVRPSPRLPPSDPVLANEKRYIAYESHSGFHNQRKALVNALLVSKLLNRTLLLPPVRLGHAISWDPNLDKWIPIQEECKKLSQDSKFNVSKNFNVSQCQDSNLGIPKHNEWTYVDWSFVMPTRELFKGYDIVDRWNDSTSWWFEPIEQGGLGLTNSEQQVYKFKDEERYSYQLFDTTKDSLSNKFKRRINLKDLNESKEFKDKRVLHFGSLFGGERIKTNLKSTIDEWSRINDAMVFEIQKIDNMSDQVRDRLGTYVGVHCRVGDMFFKNKAKMNMQVVFRKLTKNVFGLKQKRISSLLEQTENELKRQQQQQSRRHHRRWARSQTWLQRRLRWNLGDDNDDQVDDDDDDVMSDVSIQDDPNDLHHLTKRAGATIEWTPLWDLELIKPMSTQLKCRKPLHTEKELLPLNTPLYMATDSKNPLKDLNLKLFFDHFPCLFLLNNFITSSDVNQEPIQDIVELVNGTNWTSDWDNQGLSTYMFPFLEAEIAAKAIAAVGTQSSTFSGYATVTLHEAYERLGQTAGSSTT